MCDLTANEIYEQVWEDYFTYVNSGVYSKLMYNDEVYVGYGSHYELPVEDVAFWYGDAEKALIPGLDPDHYIASKYDILSDDDIQYYIDKEVEDGMLFENMGYWYSA